MNSAERISVVAAARTDRRSKLEKRVMQRTKRRADHTGSTLDSLLEEDGILAEVEAVAVKRVIDWQRQQAVKAENDRDAGRK